jgi:hypothetical protein
MVHGDLPDVLKQEGNERTPNPSYVTLRELQDHFPSAKAYTLKGEAVPLSLQERSGKRR